LFPVVAAWNFIFIHLNLGYQLRFHQLNKLISVISGENKILFMPIQSHDAWKLI
jgi:hypothetical protein